MAEITKPEAGVLQPKAFPCFNIIHHAGYPMEAYTIEGVKVFREDEIFVPEMQEAIRCAPYDDHFVYEEPTHGYGKWSHMCTCGSPAVIVERAAYRKDSALTGKMLICYFHRIYGKHQTSFFNFPQEGR
jgi:hypothetical protein